MTSQLPLEFRASLTWVVTGDIFAEDDGVFVEDDGNFVEDDGVFVHSILRLWRGPVYRCNLKTRFHMVPMWHGARPQTAFNLIRGGDTSSPYARNSPVLDKRETIFPEFSTHPLGETAAQKYKRSKGHGRNASPARMIRAAMDRQIAE